jgi:Domain of unknown function (DUF4440)
MRWLFVIAGFFFYCSLAAQAKAPAVLDRMKQFHQLMVEDASYIDQYVDDSLSYGHSNGWIENKNEFISNLGQKMVYHSVREDSIKCSVNKNIAHIRFVTDIDVAMDGKRATYRLRVLEVWVKRGKKWMIFARQALRG